MARETFSPKFVLLLLLLFVVGSLCSFAFYAPFAMRGVPNYYELLNLKPDASMPEIKKAFRVASKQLHPDKVNVEDEESRLKATRKFIEMTEGSYLATSLCCTQPFEGKHLLISLHLQPSKRCEIRRSGTGTTSPSGPRSSSPSGRPASRLPAATVHMCPCPSYP